MAIVKQIQTAYFFIALFGGVLIASFGSAHLLGYWLGWSDPSMDDLFDSVSQYEHPLRVACLLVFDFVCLAFWFVLLFVLLIWKFPLTIRCYAAIHTDNKLYKGLIKLCIFALGSVLHFGCEEYGFYLESGFSMILGTFIRALTQEDSPIQACLFDKQAIILASVYYNVNASNDRLLIALLAFLVSMINEFAPPWRQEDNLLHEFHDH